jgi:L-malate glycosyltransferase
MKICILGNARSVHIQKWCSSLVTLGHNVILISIYQGKEIPGCKIHYTIPLFGMSIFSIFLWGKVRRIIQNFAPDIVNAHYITSYGFLAVLSGFKPVIINALGTDVLMTHDQVPFSSIPTKYALAHADHVTSVAKHLVPTMKKLGAKKDIRIFPIPVDTNLFNAPSKSFVMHRIVSTRALEKIYNIETLVKAMPAVLKEYPDAKLHIIGTGEQEKKLVKSVRNLRLQECVKFLGTVSLKQMVNELCEAHIFCSISFSDGTPVSVLEAMATKTYPVVSRIPANLEWLQEESCSFVDPSNVNDVSGAIIHALSLSENERNSAVAVNYATILKRADLQKTMMEVCTYYKNILEEHLKPKNGIKVVPEVK